MKAPKDKTKRGAAALFHAIERESALDELDAIEALSDEELDRSIANAGGDPAAIRAGGRALVSELQERKTRLAWHAQMEQKLERVREEAKRKVAARARLPRAELLARIDAARRDPRFGAPVAALFQKKSAEASTDDELSLLLAQIELLETLGDP